MNGGGYLVLVMLLTMLLLVAFTLVTIEAVTAFLCLLTLACS